MKLEEILKIIKQKNISEQFFGYDEFDKILSRINANPSLKEKVEKLPDEYWQEVIEEGIIAHIDFVYRTKTGAEEDIDTRHIDIRSDDIENTIKHVPTLVYQKKRNRY